MTDNEIIELLERMITDHPNGILAEILILINSQKAEIKKLKSENEILIRNADNAFQEGLNECRDLFEPEIKSEAYKEFANRLKYGVPQEYGVISCYDIDNLVKEMVGETK